MSKRALLGVATLVLAAAVSTALPATASATVATTAAATGTYVPLTPTRILDTRRSLGASAPGAHGTVALTVLGTGGVPASAVTAVVLTVTVVSPAAAGFVTAYPAGGSAPTASDLNFVKGETVPNLVVVQPGTAGVVDLLNGANAAVQLLADVSGYYTDADPSTPGGFVPVAPTRIMDTRTNLGGSAPAGHRGVTLQVGGTPAVPSGVTAVVLNLTVTGASAAGYVTAYPHGGFMPNTSSINFSAGQTVANLSVVQISAGGAIDLYNGSAATAQIIVDVAGYYLAGTAVSAGTFIPASPYRLADSRNGDLGGRFTAHAARKLLVDGSYALPPNGVSAVVANVTVVNPSAAGYLAVYADGGAVPTSSNLNFTAGQTVANTVVAPVGADGKIVLLNGTGGTLQVIVDISGYYLHSDRTWTPEQLPSVSVKNASDALTAISCVAVGSCTAVGGADSSGGDEFLVETLSAGTWSGQVVPGPIGDSSVEINSVSCTAADACVAVGSAAMGQAQVPMIATETGGSWTTSSALTLPADASTTFPNSNLYGVACWQAGQCVAVGNYQRDSKSNSAPQELIETLSDTGWSPTELSDLGASYMSGLSGVSCPSAGVCVAIGNRTDTSTFTTSTEVAMLSGGTWSRGLAPVTSAGSFGGISCPTATYCMAVGVFAGKVATLSGGTVLSGGTWTESAVNVPNTGQASGLASVSCTAPGACAAAGGYLAYSQVGNHAPLVAVLNGGTWTVTGIPQPSYSDAHLNGIACPSSGNCVGVGDDGFAGPSVPIADTQVPSA